MLSMKCGKGSTLSEKLCCFFFMYEESGDTARKTSQVEILRKILFFVKSINFKLNLHKISPRAHEIGICGRVHTMNSTRLTRVDNR